MRGLRVRMKDRSGWVPSDNVVFQMLDGLLLLGDDPLHQVADRDDSHYALVFNYRKMSYAMGRHDGHALVQSVLWRHEIHRTRHDLHDLRFLGRLSFEDDFASVVPLRDYAYQFARRDDQQRSDSRFGHPFDGLIDRLFRLHRPDFFPLVFQDRADTVTESQHWRRLPPWNAGCSGDILPAYLFLRGIRE
jgi:hypothetical protein